MCLIILYYYYCRYPVWTYGHFRRDLECGKTYFQVSSSSFKGAPKISDIQIKYQEHK